MSIKITFKKELNVDLNEYYPSFPPGLRRQIDEALYGLLGGQAPQTRKRQPNTGDNTPMKFGAGAPQLGSKSRVLYDELKRQYDRAHFHYAAVKEMAKQLDNGAMHLASDLKRGGYIVEVN